MKKLSALLLLFLVGLGGLTTVQAQEEDPPDEPLDFQVSIDNETPVEEVDDVPYDGSNTNLAENEDFYRLTIPDVVDFDDLNYLKTIYETTDQDNELSINYSSEDDLDDYEFDYSSTMTSYILFDRFDQDPLSTSDIMGDLSDENRQGLQTVTNAFVGYFIEDDDDEDGIATLYVHEEMLDSYRTGDPDFDHELIGATFEFTTTDYGNDVYLDAYSEGLDQGFEDGEQEGLEQGREEKEVDSISFDDSNMLEIELRDGSTESFSSSYYNEAYDDGFEDGQDGDFGQAWIMSLFGAFADIFAIELLPGMTIGLVVGITMVPSVMLVFLKLFRG